MTELNSGAWYEIITRHMLQENTWTWTAGRFLSDDGSRGQMAMTYVFEQAFRNGSDVAYQ